MKLVRDAVAMNPLELVRTGFDRLWDWSIYQLHTSLTWMFVVFGLLSASESISSNLKKLRRPYELAKFIAFWSFIIFISLWMLYYLSMGIYLSFYFLVLRPPSVPVLIQPLNLRYPDPGSPDYIYAYHCIAPVTYPQTYNWKLSLEMPENPPNFDAGVFMVSLALYPPDQLPSEPQSQVRDMFYQHLRGNAGNPSSELQETGHNMRIGSRPLMLRWRPTLYRLFQTLVFMVPRMASDILGFGWFEETQLMEVNMIEKHVASKNATYNSKQCFVVSINNPSVQIYKATVQATVLLEGWRYLLYSWFWTCFFIGSFLIFGGLIIVVSSYLSIVLIMAIIRGQVKFPKLWLSDEEQQMKDMKEAVANLMLQKRSESFLRHGNSDDRLLKSDTPPDRAAFKRRSSKSGSVGELKKSQPTSDRPRSWLDEPIASSSLESNAPPSGLYLTFFPKSQNEK